jgi:hypothetical protein
MAVISFNLAQYSWINAERGIIWLMQVVKIKIEQIS